MCVLVLTAIIINIFPMVILSHEMCRKNIAQANLRADEVTSGSEFTTKKAERIVLVDECGMVTYDSGDKDNLEGKYLVIPEIKRALRNECVENAEIQDTAIETTVVKSCERGAVLVLQKDTEAIAVLKDTQESLLLTWFIVGIIFCLVINLGAFHVKKRVKTLISGVTSEDIIEIGGGDEFSELAGELNRLTRQMLETEELRRTFVSDASHELRTPLSSIQLLVDSIIQTENIDMSTTREFMTDISEQIDRLSRIAERLLILTNLDGAKALELETVDMKEVAEAVIATLEQSAMSAQVKLSCNFADGVRFKGTSDGAYQIIFNLVENAIKYNNSGGVVRVYIFKADGVCNLIVDDNGIGIPEDDFSLIFERFYRVDKARSRDKGGSGLGLSIVAKIVGYFHGDIKVEKSVDGGARFTVTFPEEVEQ